MAKRFLFSIALLATAASCFAQLPTQDERLMATARLWATVEYFHPALVSGTIDWDEALVKALPQIRSASDEEAFRLAISGMLQQLHDPQTCVLRGSAITAEQPSPQFTLQPSAAGTKILLNPRPTATETVLLDVAGIHAQVRLSQPFSAVPVVHAQPVPPQDTYPNTELRLLAAIKLWSTIHYFFAYKDLMDEDWDEIVSGSFSKFIDARDATGYNLALAELMTHLTDTNSVPHSHTLDTYFGEAGVGLDIRLLDKYPIVTAVHDPAAQKAGVQPGDVVKRIGGESTTDRFRRLVQYVPASTPQRSGFDTIRKIANGPSGTAVELSIENAKGETHSVTLTRGAYNGVQRAAEAVRILPGNIGYLDLDQIDIRGADAALARLKDTKAIIFDLRGRASAGEVIARHLTAQRNIPAALVSTLVPLHPDAASDGIATQTTSTFLVRTLPLPLVPLYKGKTIALIDERTIGESEYAGILFQAANKTEFVGSPSAGALSRIAQLALPGGVSITYATEDVRMGNGGKLQRLGLQPNVPAPTTAKGLRANKDESLEAALQQLSH